jgi:hypothetical protein
MLLIRRKIDAICHVYVCNLRDFFFFSVKKCFSWKNFNHVELITDRRLAKTSLSTKNFVLVSLRRFSRKLNPKLEFLAKISKQNHKNASVAQFKYNIRNFPIKLVITIIKTKQVF